MLCVINFHHIGFKGARARAWWIANFTHFHFTLDNNNTQKVEKNLRPRGKSHPLSRKEDEENVRGSRMKWGKFAQPFPLYFDEPMKHGEKKWKTTQHTIFAETESIVRCWRSASCNYISSSQSRHMRIVLCRFLTQRQFFTPRRRSRLCHADVSHKGEVFKFLSFFSAVFPTTLVSRFSTRRQTTMMMSERAIRSGARKFTHIQRRLIDV